MDPWITCVGAAITMAIVDYLRLRSEAGDESLEPLARCERLPTRGCR
jgi:hypothetical protein